jgi:hypothetical protein
MSGLAIYPIHQIKKHGDKERKEIYHMAWDMPWEEAKEALQPILSHLWNTDMSYSFK